jgi:hypothetical protein
VRAYEGRLEEEMLRLADSTQESLRAFQARFKDYRLAFCFYKVQGDILRYLL